MQTAVGAAQASAVSCEEPGRMGLVDRSGCCERCHSTERYAPGLVAGPCRASIPDGRAAFVCWASKKHLLEKASL
jgi:hypothetical protein